jgi:8-oxo-dGTP pyrophosphatase MutT (NUDIX family)
MVEKWERLESRKLAEYSIAGVRQDRSRSPRTGAAHDFLVLELAEWINVVPLTAQGKVVLIRQYRHGTGEVGLEIPGGAVDPGEDPGEAARRELGEETGYEAKKIVAIGQVAPNPAIQNNRCHSFLALGARPGRVQRLDAGEDIAVEEIDLERIPALIRSGAINHGLVVVAFYFLEQYRKENPEFLERFA